MSVKTLSIIALALLAANCTKDPLPQDNLTNKEQMNQLVINDPLVWNTLATQSMEIDTTGSGMKAGTGMSKEKEYPDKGYYYTIFEDLFPSQGDYDFNDIMLETKITLDAKKGEVNGRVNTTIYHKGGTLPVKLGLQFFSVKGNKEYTEINSEEITLSLKINDDDQGSLVVDDKDRWIIETPAIGNTIEVTYFITDRTNNINQLWISWYIIVSQGEDQEEIHSSGFPSTKNRKFEIPQKDFMTAGNLPWGMEIETETFYIPGENELFLNVFPDFKEWAESDGVKNKDWYENPNLALTQDRRY